MLGPCLCGQFQALLNQNAYSGGVMVIHQHFYGKSANIWKKQVCSAHQKSYEMHKQSIVMIIIVWCKIK